MNLEEAIAAARSLNMKISFKDDRVVVSVKAKSGKKIKAVMMREANKTDVEDAVVIAIAEFKKENARMAHAEKLEEARMKVVSALFSADQGWIEMIPVRYKEL